MVTVLRMCLIVTYTLYSNRPFEWNDESTAWSKGMYERVNDLKKLQSDLKVLLSFGGWIFSQGNLQLMSALMASTENRRRFINSVMEFVRKHNFDGFDLDFEYPSSNDKQNFVLLLNEMKSAFEEESVKSGKARLLFTAAVAAGYDKIDAGYDVPAVASALDFINVMTYDFHGGWENVTGMNSPLYDLNGDRYAMNNALNYWVQKGAPKQKLNVGFAAYGRGWTLRDPADKSVGAKTSGPAQTLPYSREAGIATFYEICDLLEQSAQRFEHNATKVPYLVQGNQWFAYDDEWSYKIKLNWLLEHEFGGAFVWSLDMDDFTGQCKSSLARKFPLHTLILETLRNGMNKLTTTIHNTSFTPEPTISHTSNTAYLQSTTSNPASTTGSSARNTSKSSAMRSQITTGQFKCAGVGIYSDPGDCRNFYLCHANGMPYRQTCPAALLYNSDIMACDWPRNVNCDGSS